MTLSRLALFLVIFLAGCSTGYKNDGNAVYYWSWNEGNGGHKERLDANPRTFKILRHNEYAKDEQYVFYKGNRVPGADAATFETLGEWYARDKNFGYYGDRPIISSHGKTFRVIDSYYSTDEGNVFYDTLPLNVCSTKDFRFVYKESEWYARWTTDGCFYYYMNYKVPSTDYENMTVYNGSGGLAKDRHYVYVLDHQLNYDVNGKKVVDTIDAASFQVTGFLECRDKWGCFNPYHGRIDCKAN